MTEDKNALSDEKSQESYRRSVILYGYESPHDQTNVI